MFKSPPPALPLDYALLDSGDGEKLERFGCFTTVRPASQAIWKRRQPELWQQADNRYDSNKKRWQNKVPAPSAFKLDDRTSFNLTLLENGQTGLFPEHYSYLEEICKSYSAGARVLSLFAYTGMATCLLAKSVAEFTHVDLSGQALNWAKKNLELNQARDSNVKIIKEDALKYLERTVKRGQVFDLIILDPTTFSRVSKNNTWHLDEELPGLIKNLKAALAEAGQIYFTAHLTRAENQLIANLFYDAFGDYVQIEQQELTINETSSPRKLSASFLIKITRGSISN